MTKADLIKELNKIRARQERDEEVNHSDADNLLLKYINSAAVTKAYDDIEKWYA